MDLSRALEILEIDETASLSEIKQAYRNLANVWHPDHHSQNPRLLEKSQEKMKELNAAYAFLSSNYSKLESRKVRRTYYDDQEIKIIKCYECGALNSIQSITGVVFKCARCKSNLLSEKQYERNI